LWNSCKDDYKKYECSKEREHVENPSEHGEASLLLMCLTKKEVEGQSYSKCFHSFNDKYIKK